MSPQKTLVISAVNFTEGGPLTVLRDCVETAAQVLPDWRIIVMAHDAALLQTPGIEVRAFPQTKTSWLKRIALEWVGFKRISEELDPDLWLSLHDMTPRVKARRQAVYCHNPAPFSRPTLRDSWFEPKYLAFALFYTRLYASFISRNHAVIVQQQWLREEFQRRFGIRRVIVAYPQTEVARTDIGRSDARPVRSPVFLYPAIPRCFKNFEIIGQALAILEQDPTWSGTVRWTIDGTENRYSRWLKAHFGQLRSLQWIGRQTKDAMQQEYGRATSLLFPSRVETWGLPITEAKQAGLPLLVADLPYARETVGSYDQAAFFDPRDPAALASCMRRVSEDLPLFAATCAANPSAPYAESWPSLLRLLTADL